MIHCIVRSVCYQDSFSYCCLPFLFSLSWVKMKIAFHVCNSQTTASHLFLFFFIFKAYLLSLTVECVAMKKSQSVFGSTLENEDISACLQLLAWLFYVFQATEQFWFLFYIKDEIFNECRVCECVCEGERERRQSRGASEWETRERDRGSNVKHHQLCCDLTGWMYRLFVMSSVCVTHRLPGGGWGGEGGSKKRTRDSLGFVKVIAMQINCVWIAWKVCLHLLSVRIISHNKEDQRGL